MRRGISGALTTIVALLFAVASNAASLGYDPQADPFEQYHQAVAQAQAQHKLVLVIAGGDWCHWCHALNRLMEGNSDVQSSLDDTFVIMKVYVGFDNYNEFFFSQLPTARGAPHLWVISPDRDVLASQSIAAFEQGRSGYNKQQFMEFIEHWKQRMPRAGASATAGS